MEMRTRRKTTRIKDIKPKSIKYDVKIDHQNDRGIRRIRFIGHIMRHDNLVLDTMEGKINEKRKRDTIPGNPKKKMSWPSYETTERLTEKKEDWLQQQNGRKCLLCGKGVVHQKVREHRD